MTEYTDMSWDELVEKAKELGYEITEYSPYKENKIGQILSKYFDCTSIDFLDKGEIWVDGATLAFDRTPSQMYQIMLALED